MDEFTRTQKMVIQGARLLLVGLAFLNLGYCVFGVFDRLWHGDMIVENEDFVCPPLSIFVAGVGLIPRNPTRRQTVLLACFSAFFVGVPTVYVLTVLSTHYKYIPEGLRNVDYYAHIGYPLFCIFNVAILAGIACVFGTVAVHAEDKLQE